MTKQQLGFCFIVLAVTAAIGITVIDLVGASNFDGVGPAQRLALLACAAAFLLGLSLIPLGDRPA
jgi:lipopolysaccharide export LptBFGC system permease protein LptF